MTNKIIKSYQLYFVLTFIFIFKNHEVFGQKDLVDLFIPATVLIKYSSGASSSGVIVSDSSYLYLVTAKHCLLDNKNQLIESSISIIYYLKDPYEGKADTLSINLYQAQNQKNLLSHNRQDIGVLVLAKITGYTNTGSTMLLYSKSVIKTTKYSPGGISTSLCLDFRNVEVGNDCLILGYPLSLETSENIYDFNRPLLRQGVISGKDKLRGTIIVDCPVYKGNSGGPVISSFKTGKSKIGLFGIVSGTIFQREELVSSYFKETVSINLNNSGYSAIVPIEYAIELMKVRKTYK